MIVFFTDSANHLSKEIKFTKGTYTFKKFCDGEIYINLNVNVKNQKVWIVSSTQSPTDNILELTFLLDAIKRNGASQINLFFTYFGYARQDKALEGEALGSQVIFNFLKQFEINKTLILHPHEHNLLTNYYEFDEVIPFDLYCKIVNNIDLIVAPDKGASRVCNIIAQKCGIDFAWIEKTRPEQEKVEIVKFHGQNVKNKKILILDDIITTGNTILNASKYLLLNGAKSIDIIATHGIFCNESRKRLQDSPISSIYVTNSIFQRDNSDKIKLIDISSFIESKILDFEENNGTPLKESHYKIY